MKLTNVEIRNYRSIFETGANAPGLQFDVVDGLNVLVGKNNCGKSNVFRALAAALDPAYEFDEARDIPGPIALRYPSIQLWFQCDEAVPGERSLLEKARDYELSATKGEATRADRGQLVLRVSWAPDGEGYEKRERLVFLDGSDDPGAKSSQSLLEPALKALHDSIRFVLVSSGESIQSVLEGSFREILHSVVQDQLEAQFAQAEQHRTNYIKGLESDLLSPLRDHITDVVARLFPEIQQVSLTPEVSDIETTLAKVQIALQDTVNTPLSDKGTGVRGGVLVAMLRYLAREARKCVIFAVEEPEAFLHPAAQENLREDLESLAERDDIAVLVTTHSPFFISSRDAATATLLEKDHDGRTRIAAQSRGADSKVSVISGLLRDDSYNALFDASLGLGDDKAAALLVEGFGDKHYIEMAARLLGRPGLISDLEIVVANGTTQMPYMAPVLKATTSKPVGVLVDNDADGRQAVEKLRSLKYQKAPLFSKKQLVSYASVMKDNDFGWEAEDLFPHNVIGDFVQANGGIPGPACSGHVVHKKTGHVHYDLDGEAKTSLGAYLEEHLTSADLDRWAKLLEHIRASLGLPDEAEVDLNGGAPGADFFATSTPVLDLEVDSFVEQEAFQLRAEPLQLQVSGPDLLSPPPNVEASTKSERVLVVSERFGHAEYIQNKVFAGDPGRGLSPDIRFVAFYEDGQIRQEVPRVLARHDDLVYSRATVEKLRSTGDERDGQVANVVEDDLVAGRRGEGDIRQVFLLSDPEAQATIRLDHAVRNTKKSPKGKPMAWVVRHRMTTTDALIGSPQTTDEIEAIERELAAQ